MASKSSQPEVSFSAGAESGSWRPHHSRVFQQIVEELPGTHPLRRLQPDIGSVHAAGHVVARAFQPFVNSLRVSHIVGYLLFQLRLPGLRVNCFPGPLYDIGRPVVLGPVASGPQRMEHHIPALQIFGDHRCPKPYPGEPGVLGETAKLDGTGSGPLALIDGVGHVRL